MKTLGSPIVLNGGLFFIIILVLVGALLGWCTAWLVYSLVGTRKGVQLSQLHQQNYWYYCLVGALLALASGKAERRQVGSPDKPRGKII